MAGGVGSRFWPMSTVQTPKQFLDILGTGRTLLQLTADRFKETVDSKNVWVVTSKSYLYLVKDQLPNIPEDQILLEPCMRNTAPCIAYAAWKIKNKFPEANLVVSPADHIVLDQAEFTRIAKKCFTHTANNSDILTLGMKPSRPETGYGYIQADIEDKNDIKQVIAFREKPNLQTAKQYLQEGNFTWNAGIFFWTVKTLQIAFREFLPSLAQQFDAMDTAFYKYEEKALIEENFPKCEKISVDYGIMEKAKNIKVYPANFGWSDLGTWGSLHEQVVKDAENNAVIGDNVKLIESNNCIIHIPEGRRYVVQGLNDYIIAEKNNTVLICKKSEEQRIKEFSD